MQHEGFEVVVYNRRFRIWVILSNKISYASSSIVECGCQRHVLSINKLICESMYWGIKFSQGIVNIWRPDEVQDNWNTTIYKFTFLSKKSYDSYKFMWKLQFLSVKLPIPLYLPSASIHYEPMDLVSSGGKCDGKHDQFVHPTTS